jgi:cytochrome c-type biogenesis protein CcmF
MIPELGHFALILALCMAIIQSLLPLIGSLRLTTGWIAVARPAVFGQFLFVLIAYCCLTYAFLTHDFSVAYVAHNSNTSLPIIYLISGVWGSHEGSLLLWALVLSLWTILVALFSRSIPMLMTARVLSVMGMISFGFILFIKNV